MCNVFTDRCLTFGPFSFGHCVICRSSIYAYDNPADILILFFPFQWELSRTLGKGSHIGGQSKTPKLSHMS